MTSDNPSAVVFAYHNIGVRCLQVLLARHVQVSLVVTHLDDAKETIWFESVISQCQKHNIPYITPSDAEDPDLYSKIHVLSPQFIFSFYYRSMIPTNILNLAARGAYNMHGSLLPKYQGRAPVNWAIIHGETETGITLHEMVAEPDAGAIVAQLSIPIFPDETAFQVHSKLSTLAEHTLWTVLPDIVTGTIQRRSNDVSKGCYFGGRKPEDGHIDWSKPANEVYNLHRAVEPPYPGAWTVISGREFTIEKARLSDITIHPSWKRGLNVFDDRIFGLCGDDACIEIHQLLEHETPISAQALGILLEEKYANDNSHHETVRLRDTRSIFILGINGFIGHHLCRRILETSDDSIVALDLNDDRIRSFLDDPEYKNRIFFKQGDMLSNWEWIEKQVSLCNIVVPLAGVATPSSYVKTPLRVFELIFEANLKIIRVAAKYKKRLIFPSTSEVYGMCPDSKFSPEQSNLVYGPIHKTRWIYACCKQLLDRVIFSYGAEGLDFTIFRPFNWIGAGLDSPYNTEPASSRVTTQFLGHILRGEDIVLVDGGSQRRTFTAVNDGISALIKIIANKSGIA